MWSCQEASNIQGKDQTPSLERKSRKQSSLTSRAGFRIESDGYDQKAHQDPEFRVSGFDIPAQNPHADRELIGIWLPSKAFQ